MVVKLLHHTPLWVCSTAIRKCWASEGRSDTDLTGNFYDFTLSEMDSYTGDADKALIDRIGNKNKHASTLEHLTYNFDIDGISRACLQELARHRMASLSVKSTRYTLKELKEEDSFITSRGVYDGVYQEGDYDLKRAKNYLVYTQDLYVDMASVESLEKVRLCLFHGSANDKAKFALPEAYKTSLVWTINARSLQNFLALRTSKAALWEIRDLANEIFNSLPGEHKYLFEEYITTTKD